MQRIPMTTTGIGNEAADNSLILFKSLITLEIK